MATDNEQLVLSISADVRQIQRQMKSLVGQTQRDTKAIEDAFGGIDKAASGAFDGVAANSNRAFGVASNGARQFDRAMNSSRLQTANLSAQLNDIGVQLAGGQSPFLIALQQGTQITQALGPGAGLRGSVAALGGAFTSILNPVSLATIAIIALGGEAINYFSSLMSDGEDAEKTLKAHADLIATVAKEWGDAVPALKAYAEAAEQAQSVSQLREATDLHIDEIFAQAREQVDGMSVGIAEVISQLQGMKGGEASIYEIQSAFDALNEAIDGGKDSTNETRQLTNALLSVWLNKGVSSAQTFAGSINKIAEAFANYAKQAEEARKQAEAAIQARRVEEMQKTLPGNLGQLSPIYSGNGRFMNQGEAQDARASGTQSQFQTEAEKAAKSVSKVKDSFDGLSGTVDRYVNQVVKAESGGRANAKNPNSSATGLGQFIESTWLSLFKQHFPDRAKNMSDATILALRNDADVSREMIKAYASQNAQLLRSAGVAVNEAALHLSHFLGPQGAIAVLQAKAGTLASDVLSAGAVAANPTILGGGSTVDDVIAYAERRAGAYDKMRESAKALKVEQRELNQSAEEFSNIGVDAVGGFLSDLRNGVSVADALKNALNRVLDSVIQIGLQNIFGGGGAGGRKGGLLGGFLIPGILHSGGVAGQDGYGHGRAVSPSVFAGAKRYHTGGVAGLQPGEVPAILQRGEVVLPRGTKTGSGGSVYSPTYHIDARGADQAAVARLERGLQARDRTESKRIAGMQHLRETRTVRP